MISTIQTGGKEREGMEYVQIKEFACIGGVIGGGFQNTKELHVMKYKEGMTTDNKEYLEAAV